MTINHNFYTELQSIDNIAQITDTRHYVDVPTNWLIALTDVAGSTKAIEAGRYKDVNSIAAASISAILNIVPYDIPFVFGGDGATILIPPDVEAEVRDALIATHHLARDQFRLDLRVGMIPVQDVLASGHPIRVAKLKMSLNFQQAIFTGGGISEAERMLKNPAQTNTYLLQTDVPGEANYQGFECRWNSIRGPYDEVVSLMVQAIAEDEVEQRTTYQEVIRRIEEIYGDLAKRHPITTQNMHLVMNPFNLKNEAKVVHQTTDIRRLLKMLKGSLKAQIGMWFKVGQWGTYKDVFVGATDNEKFDDTLRMIISGNKAQSKLLREFLEAQNSEGKLVFGIQKSSHSLVTCIIFDYFGRQVHFVDGANGGYALAALEMKNQLKTIA